MMSLRRKHRCFGMGFLLAWALSHCAVVNAQNEPARPTPTDKIRRTLEQVIALEYQGNSFNDAIAHLKDRTQLPVIVDQLALQQMGLMDGVPINIELRNVRGKVRQAMQHLLSGYNLTYVILEDTLLITTEESAVARQMRQRVPIDFNEIAAGKALRDIARQAGVSLVLDPRVGKTAALPVSLQLEEASVETGLRLIAELVDLKAVRMGNVIFVTDPARADRIRKEEAATIETRNGVPGVLFNGMAGGGIGGIAMPAVPFNAPPAIAPPAVEPAQPQQPQREVPKAP